MTTIQRDPFLVRRGRRADRASGQFSFVPMRSATVRVINEKQLVFYINMQMGADASDTDAATREVLDNAGLMAQIRASRRDFAEGRTVRDEDLRDE